MRVLHVIARMNVGGTATYLANLLDGLKSQGVSNLLVMGNVPEGEKEDSIVQTLNFVRVESMSREIRFGSDRKAKLEIESIIKSFKPDLIHTHTFKAGFLVRISKRDVPVVHTFHGHHLYDPEFGFVKRTVLNVIERRLAKRTNALVTVGNKVRDELLKVRIGKAKQYLPIAPGIQNLQLRSNSDLRVKFGFSEKDKLIMWLGRFTEVKRPERVIEIARLVPDAKFVMAGDGEMFDSVKASAPNNVHFLGFQDKTEMWSMADIALCTSDSEGMPLSLIEAQMAGIPVVTTDVGAVSEIVLDGETGYLGKSDAKDLADKILKLLQDEEMSIKMGFAASDNAKKLFSVEVMTSAHVKLYREVLGRLIK